MSPVIHHCSCVAAYKFLSILLIVHSVYCAESISITCKSFCFLIKYRVMYPFTRSEAVTSGKYRVGVCVPVCIFFNCRYNLFVEISATYAINCLDVFGFHSDPVYVSPVVYVWYGPMYSILSTVAAASTTGSPSNPSLGIYIYNGDGTITF